MSSTRCSSQDVARALLPDASRLISTRSSGALQAQRHECPRHDGRSTSALAAARVAGVALLLACAGRAQDAYVAIDAPSNRVIAGAKLALAVSFTNQAGTPLDTTNLVWTSSNPGFGTVTSAGVLTGLMPGDVIITATDSSTSASDTVLIHVVPSAIIMTPPSIELSAGS